MLWLGLNRVGEAEQLWFSLIISYYDNTFIVPVSFSPHLYVLYLMYYEPKQLYIFIHTYIGMVHHTLQNYTITIALSYFFSLLYTDGISNTVGICLIHYEPTCKILRAWSSTDLVSVP